MYDNAIVFDYQYYGENRDTVRIVLKDTVIILDDSVRVLKAHVQSIAKKNK